MVSPEKAYIFLQSFGKGYTFADRMINEAMVELTQHVEAGFEDELDPKRKLAMITLEVKCSARCNVIKSMGFIKGTVVGRVETEMRRSYTNYFDGLCEKLQLTCEQRL